MSVLGCCHLASMQGGGHPPLSISSFISRGMGTSLLVQQLRLCSQRRWPRFHPRSGNWIPHASTKSSHAATKDLACHN